MSFPSAPKKILVRATNWVGDAVMSLPALHALRERFPDSHIAVLARPWVSDLYGSQPFCSEVIPYTAERGPRDFGSKLRIAMDLRRRGFDCAILLQNAFEAAALVWIAGIPRRIGYDRDGRRLFLTDSVAVPKPGEIPAHERYYYLHLLYRAGILDTVPQVDAIRLDNAFQIQRAGTNRFEALGIHSPVIGISPGAAYGTAKRWLPERFAESAIRIAREWGGAVAIFGSPDERQLCESVGDLIQREGIRALNFGGQTSLREFIELAAACRVFLTNDSGAMHIASALGVPTLAVFGATNHVGTGPTGQLARIVREPVDCSPCLLRECPIDHRCMTRITSERVAREAMELVRMAV